MPALGQNTSQNGSENVSTTMQSEQAERARIKRERTSATQELAAQRQACYQKLAVTPCLNEARDAHNEKARDLKRQDVALNDAQRKRAAADRVKALDQRNSPEAQLKRAQERGKALDASARRVESQAQRQKNQEVKIAEAAAQAKAKPPSTSSSSSKQNGVPVPQPQGNPRFQQAKKVAPAHSAGQAERSAKSAQQAAQRERAAQSRREKAAQREAKRKKPAAAGLPVPADAK